MTDEERQRQIEFILNTLASAGAKIDATAESLAQAEQERKASELERKADAVRISRLEESLVTYSELSQRIYERLDDAFVNIAQLSDNISRQSDNIAQQSERIAQQSDNISRQSERISRLSEGMYRLSERVAERFDDHESRIGNVEDAIVILTKLLNRGDNGASGS